jgi:hypothetical protein
MSANITRTLATANMAKTQLATRKLSLFILTSLDGKVARSNGED